MKAHQGISRQGKTGYPGKANLGKKKLVEANPGKTRQGKSNQNNTSQIQASKSRKGEFSQGK